MAGLRMTGNSVYAPGFVAANPSFGPELHTEERGEDRE